MKFALYRLSEADGVEYLELVAVYKCEKDLPVRRENQHVINLETGEVIL